MNLKEVINSIYDYVRTLGTMLHEFHVVFMLDDFPIPIDEIEINIKERRIELHEKGRIL